jgi:hypothetical protein
MGPSTESNHRSIAATIEVQPDSTERREWVRTTLPGVEAALSWPGEEGRQSCCAQLLEIGGGGAAVLTDAELPDVPLWLELSANAFPPGPIEAVQILRSAQQCGKSLVRLRFVTPLDSVGATRLPRERRKSLRFPARETHAIVCWHDHDQDHLLAAELVNISTGGAAIRTSVEIPLDCPVRLALKPDQIVTSDVQANVLESTLDSCDRHFSRLEFTEPCPSDLYQLAVFGPPDISAESV